MVRIMYAKQWRNIYVVVRFAVGRVSGGRVAGLVGRLVVGIFSGHGGDQDNGDEEELLVTITIRFSNMKSLFFFFFETVLVRY